MLERILYPEPAMRLKSVFAIAFLCVAAACSSTPKRTINPPGASLQQLQVRPDGQWQLSVRLQNFSSVSTAFASMHGTLTIGGQDAGSFDLAPGLSIGPESADVVQATLRPSLAAKTTVASALAAGQSLRDVLGGTSVTSDPKGSYPLSYESALNPAPGLPGVMR
jgi:hypothetical protein